MSDDTAIPAGATPADTLVRVDGDGTVLQVTLDSPGTRNALGSTLVAQLRAALARAAADPQARAVVLTHSGGTFCAGADLGEALRRGLDPQEATAEAGAAMVDLVKIILTSPKPVIAVVDGHVRAGGFGLVAAADIVLAGPSATFALTESRLGLAPSIISIPVLARMSPRAAARYFLSGETFTGAAAAASGLVTAAFDDVSALAQELGRVLDGMRKASPQGLAVSKALANAAVLDGFDEAARERSAESAALFASDEAREGMTAFLSKQKPSWDVSGS